MSPSYDRYIVRIVVACLIAFSGCGGCNRHGAVSDAPTFSEGAVFDSPADALDGAIDAMVDAPPDACTLVGSPSDAMVPVASPRCTTAPTTLLDVGTSRVSGMAELGGVLYVSAYDLNSSDMVTASRVIAVDLVTATASTIQTA